MNTPWVFTGRLWHRVRIMRTTKPWIRTHCGLERYGGDEYYWDPRGQLPLGFTCRRCYP